MANRYEVDQRAALFGARSSGIPIPPKRNEIHAAHSRQNMEDQNNAAIDDIAAKVAQLKDVSKGVHKEVKDSNSLLESMGVHFDNASTQLKGTLGTLSGMMQKGKTELCRMVFIALVALVILYFAVSKMFGGGGKPTDLTAELQQNTTGGSD